jgi:hyperosmotically inducible periplasmic protein
MPEARGRDYRVHMNKLHIALLYHRSTSAVSTRIKTKNGVVTLSGKAGNAAEKALVTKLAVDVPGVKNGTNRMTITGSE